MSLLVRATWTHRRPWTTIALIAVVAMGLHALFLPAALKPDEGGYLLVAQQWHGIGPLLYGNLFVDRPPLLLLAYGFAGQLGPVGVHLLAAVASGVLVIAAGWAGWATAGESAGRWAALTAAALSASVLLDTPELDGELLAAPLVMTSSALLLHAVHRSTSSRRRLTLTAAAAVVAVAAVLMKQNFVDGLVFGFVLLVLSGLQAQVPTRLHRAMLATWTGSAVVASGAVAAWAQAYGQLHSLWLVMYEFRARAAQVIQDGSLHAPGNRLIQLIGFALASGLVFLLIGSILAHRRALRRADPVVTAMTAALLVQVVGIALGGSFWVHYLIGLIPMVALGAGIAASQRARWRRIHLSRLIVLAALITAVSTPAYAVASFGEQTASVRAGRWLADVSRPGDTVVVAFGHPNVIHESGLSTLYPYIWSLPVRTLDPNLLRFELTIRSPDPPTWIVQLLSFDTWGLDPQHAVAQDVAARYRVVGDVCGLRIWLRNGVQRPTDVPVECPGSGEINGRSRR